MTTIPEILEKLKALQSEVEQLLGNSEELKTTTIKCSGSIEVKPHDEPEQMTWHEAMEKFGPNGSDPDWRLPTREELLVMCLNKDDTYEGSFYWSSTEYGTIHAWYQDFSNGIQFRNSKTTSNDVRCVRRDQSFNHSVVED